MFSRERETHVTGEDELAAVRRAAQPRIFAILTTGIRDARTCPAEIGRPEGPTAVMMFPVLPVKSNSVDQIGNRALEHDDAQVSSIHPKK